MNNGFKERKQPERKCLGCQERFPKRELIRVVRTPEGEIILDETGKKNGRGAYLCKNGECLKRAHRQRRLEAALESQVPETVYARLEEELSCGK